MLAFALTNVAYSMEWAEARLTLNGFLKNWTGYRFGTYGHERGEGLSMFRNVLQLEAEAKVLEDVSLYTIWRAVREPAYSLEDEAVDFGNFDEDVLNEERFREYYLTWQATDRVWLRVGEQQVVWGDMMGFRVMDIINPLDRPMEDIEKDLEDQLISERTATGVYHVVLDPETRKIDPDKTRELREAERKARLKKAIPVKEFMKAQRDKILGKNISEICKKTYNDCFQNSSRFLNEFKECWGLPEDFEGF